MGPTPSHPLPSPSAAIVAELNWADSPAVPAELDLGPRNLPASVAAAALVAFMIAAIVVMFLL